MADNLTNHFEEENLVEDCERYVLKNIKNLGKIEIEKAIDDWIQKTSIKVFAKDKLIQRVYEDLRKK